MDWAKAKSILIVVFLVINAFLVLHLYNVNRGDIMNISDEKLDKVIKYLNKNKTYVEAHVPEKIENLYPLAVNYKQFTDQEIAALFRQKGIIKETENINERILELGSVVITIRNNKELHYIDKSIQGVVNDNQRLCQDEINDFLSILGLDKIDKYFELISSENGYRKVRYGQRYKGDFIGESFIEVLASSNGIREAHIVWFGGIHQVKNDERIISPLDALSRTMIYYQKNPQIKEFEQPSNRTYMIARSNHSNVRPIVINKVEKGYYVKLNDTIALEEPLADAVPVWRVTTERHNLYINAYDEHIEYVDYIDNN